MSTLPLLSSLQNSYIIGQQNFDSWSQGFNPDGYLKVLPRPNEKVVYQDPFLQWQIDHQNYQDGVFISQGANGEYYSSWGPAETLEVDLYMDELEQIVIDGFGILQQGDGFIDWLGKSTPYDILRAYNGRIPGPMMITEPGDTLKITLHNNLDQPTNFHSHGLHVSPVGHGDNVLVTIAPGDSWDVEIKIPDNHFIGPQWYHPHLHGLTNEQVASGLAGYLLINPRHDLPDLDKFDPVTNPTFFMAIQTYGIQQENRPSRPNDPLNQSEDSSFSLPAGTPLAQTINQDGDPVYTISNAPYVSYSGLVAGYDPTDPLGGRPYGEGLFLEPVENVIHTINGQYNPTIETTTGEWNLFSFANMSVNSFFIVQLYKEEADGTLTPQELLLTAIDGDAAGVVEGIRRDVMDSPILNPGSRMSLQNWFEEPGKYYFLANGTAEVIGDHAPFLTQNKGFDDGHLTWAPQVLATVEVTGDPIPTGPFPEVYDFLIDESNKINNLVDRALAGDVDKERTFIWSANIGGAISEGRFPDDTEVETFEGTYRINGEYYATEGITMTPLTMPMLGTTEIWDVVNVSGLSDPTLEADLPLLEWHPFHIHQNDFVVLEINGIPVSDIEQNYLERVLSDTVALPPTHAPGSVTPQNPYGTPQIDGDPSVVRILMEFLDFPGAYVNHCHILFHEDAGMMAVVRVILNTEDTWLGLDNDHGDSIHLSQASNTDNQIHLTPYGHGFTGGVQVAIADINNKTIRDANNVNVNDNITDVATIQRKLTNPSQEFAIKVFDGDTLFINSEFEYHFSGNDPNTLLAEIKPFQDINTTTNNITSIAAGDINGDGFADVVVSIGGGIAPRVEIYSGQNFELLGRFNPFHHEDFTGNVNIAVGDVNGDNFDDIIISQGAGGRGLVELYDGREFDRIIRTGEINTLSANGVAHETEILASEFQPYGPNFTGEIKVTSGYVLQTPEEPNGLPVQTAGANITTMAIGDVPHGHDQIKIHALLGGHGHHSSSAPEATSDQPQDHSNHEGHDHSASGNDQILLQTSFTPDVKLTNFDGTFADIHGKRGKGVIVAQDINGNEQFISLHQQNNPEFIAIDSGHKPSPQPPVSPPRGIFDEVLRPLINLQHHSVASLMQDAFTHHGSSSTPPSVSDIISQPHISHGVHQHPLVG